MEVTRRLQRGDLGDQHVFTPRDTQASSGIATQAIVVDSSSDTAPDATVEADVATAAACTVSGEDTTQTAPGASCSEGDASLCGISGEEGGTGSYSVPRSYYPASLEGHQRMRHGAAEPILSLQLYANVNPFDERSVTAEIADYAENAMAQSVQQVHSVQDSFDFHSLD